MIRMTRKNVGVVLAIAAVAAIGIGAAVKASDETQSSFTFNITNGKIADINSAHSPGGSAITGSQNVPNVGTCTLTGKLFITGGTNHGNMTITVKKTGAQIHFTFTGKTETGDENELEGNVTITGGTKTYSTAFGGGTYELFIGPAIGDTDSHKFTLVTQGSITF